MESNDPASSVCDAGEPERKTDISERLKRKQPGSACVSGREEKAKRRRNSVDLHSEAVVVDTLSVYQELIRRWRESHPPPPQPAEGNRSV